MYQLALTKPDGRSLTLYSRQPLVPGLVAPSPFPNPLEGQAHLRWHPLRDEWVTYAAFRQGRTFLPPPEYNPLAVTRDAAHPTEVPAGDWDIAVFDNRFPSLAEAPPNAPPPPSLIVPTAPANGHCEVVVFTQDPNASLGALSLSHMELLLRVWGERTRVLGAKAHIQFVLPFENRGAEVGVTLHHPHGQIYAYPVVPPVPAKMQEVASAHYDKHGRGVLETLIGSERTDSVRMLFESRYAVAFVPVCARYPYEVWVAPVRAVSRFDELNDEERADLARALKTVLLKYDGLWDRPMPYLMVWYQAPTDGLPHPESHLHAELYPAYRTRDRLKYLAGTEIGAGFFAMDALPEEKARELQQVEVRL